MPTHHEKSRRQAPLISLGDIHISKRVKAELAACAVTTATLLERYVAGDWSNLSAEDIKANRASIHDGGRILTSYHIAPTVRIWIIAQSTDQRSERIFLKVSDIRRSPDPDQMFLDTLRYEELDYGFYY